MVAKQLIKKYKQMDKKEQDKFFSMLVIYNRRQFFKMIKVEEPKYSTYIEYRKRRPKRK